VKTFYKSWLPACTFGVASMMLVTVGAADRQASSSNANFQFRAQETWASGRSTHNIKIYWNETKRRNP
jgi:hypothetical protein